MGIARVGERIRYEPTRMRAAEGEFRRRYPQFDQDGALEELRRSEYARLDETNQIYLDYTGGGLHGTSQVHKYEKLLHVVRVAAGTTTVIGAIAFSFAYFEKRYWPLQVVAVLKDLSLAGMTKLPTSSE